MAQFEDSEIPKSEAKKEEEVEEDSTIKYTQTESRPADESVKRTEVTSDVEEEEEE